MRLFYLLLIVVFAFALISPFTACGVVGEIEGGPKDSANPILIRTLPSNGQISVPQSVRKIFFAFNEFVQTNRTEDVRINPRPKKRPKIEADKSILLITFDSLLDAHATYHIDLPKVVGDLNENNLLDTLSLVFSTGTSIDSGSIEGRIIEAKTGKPDSLSSAILYPADNFVDSTVRTRAPRYVTPTDSLGRFYFSYLPQGKYYLFALKDKDNNMRYSTPSEAFAFLDTPVLTSKMDTLRTLPKDSTSAHVIRIGKEATISENEHAPKIKDTTHSTFDALTLFSYFTEKKIRQNEEEVERKRIKGKLVLSYKLVDIENNTLERNGDIEILVRDSLVKIDTNKIKIMDTAMLHDTLSAYENVYIKKITLTLDSLKQTHIHIATYLDFDEQYALVLEKNFASADKIMMEKSDTLMLTMLPEEGYISKGIYCENCEALQYPSVVISAGIKPISTLALRSDTIYTPYLRENTYGLVLFDDVNENGVQDKGDFEKRIQPEQTYLIEDDKLIIKSASKDKKAHTPTLRDKTKKQSNVFVIRVLPYR